MAELTCDDYMLKLNEIISACNNVETTKIQLEALLGELETLDNQIDTDILAMTTPPTTMEHLNKYVIVQYSRLSKILLHNALLTIVKKRAEEQRQREQDQSGTYEERRLYEEETENVRNYVDTVKSSCICMSSRTNIINCNI